jgi:inner membrane transporter RhtA
LYGIAMAGMNAAFYSALQYIPLGIAVTVEFLGPLALALAMTRRWRDAAWAAMAGAGVLLLGLGAQGSSSTLGLALAMLAGAFWAGYILTSAKVGSQFPGLDGLAVALVVASLLTAPFGAASAMTAFTDPTLLAKAALVALLSSILVYGLEMAALRRLSSRVFSVMLSLEPATAALAGFVVLGQLLTGADIVGLVMVSVASAAVAYSGRGTTMTIEPLD